MQQVEISIPGWLFGKTKYRRDLPTKWGEVAPARRLPLVRGLLAGGGLAGRIEALRLLLNIPKHIFLALDDLDVAALLACTEWLDCAPTPEPILLSFEHAGKVYHAPKSHGLNLLALEFPIADEAFGNFVRTGDLDALRLLVGTLYREENPDKAAAERRGDVRVPLLSRWEAEARASRLDGLPSEVATAALLYFAGVKLFVNQAYGKALFADTEDAEKSPDGKPAESHTANPIGWWGVYFSLAEDGPFGRNVEEVYQTSFHDVCLYLADRKRTMARMQMQQRMQSPDFGIENY